MDWRFYAWSALLMLVAGDHDVEFVYFEGPFASALGPLARGPGQSQFALVGDSGLDVSGAIPAIEGSFSLREVIARMLRRSRAWQTRGARSRARGQMTVCSLAASRHSISMSEE